MVTSVRPDKLGRYGDSKSDGWATFFRRLGEMYKTGETQYYSDTIIPNDTTDVCRVIRDENWVHNIEKYDQSIGAGIVCTVYTMTMRNRDVTFCQYQTQCELAWGVDPGVDGLKRLRLTPKLFDW